MNHLKMTVLVDNTAKPLFLCEWGLSILIDADDTRILLDTGSSGMFAENAKQLGIDLASVRIGVLSHAHYDHSDGLDTFFSLNETSPFLIRAGSEENCFSLKDGAMEYIGIRKGFSKDSMTVSNMSPETSNWPAEVGLSRTARQITPPLRSAMIFIFKEEKPISPTAFPTSRAS